ncbi:MAG: hypothetical protein K1X51_13600 [Rhodospirillaceae bacterium]|nr:hypothetical protein [Rhodospirillaceae bacterium]
MQTGTPSKTRVLVAFAVTPFLMPSILWAALTIITASSRELSFSALFWSLALGSLITVPATIVLGIPMYMALRKLQWRSLTAFAFGGGVIGVVAAYLLREWSPQIAGGNPEFVGFFVCALCGALSSAGFWLMAKPAP